MQNTVRWHSDWFLYINHWTWVYKVWTFWKEHKIWKNLPLKIWHHWVTSNFKWKIFSNFVSLSECLNFNYLDPLVKWKWCKFRGLCLHSTNVVILPNRSKSTGKETGKTHLCAVENAELQNRILCTRLENKTTLKVTLDLSIANFFNVSSFHHL